MSSQSQFSSPLPKRSPLRHRASIMIIDMGSTESHIYPSQAIVFTVKGDPITEAGTCGEQSVGNSNPNPFPSKAISFCLVNPKDSHFHSLSTSLVLTYHSPSLSFTLMPRTLPHSLTLIRLSRKLQTDCSHCTKRGISWGFTSPDGFNLEKGREFLKEYEFGAKSFKHLVSQVASRLGLRLRSRLIRQGHLSQW